MNRIGLHLDSHSDSPLHGILETPSKFDALKQTLKVGAERNWLDMFLLQPNSEIEKIRKAELLLQLKDLGEALKLLKSCQHVLARALEQKVYQHQKLHDLTKSFIAQHWQENPADLLGLEAKVHFLEGKAYLEYVEQNFIMCLRYVSQAIGIASSLNLQTRLEALQTHETMLMRSLGIQPEQHELSYNPMIRGYQLEQGFKTALLNQDYDEASRLAKSFQGLEYLVKAAHYLDNETEGNLEDAYFCLSHYRGEVLEFQTLRTLLLIELVARVQDFEPIKKETQDLLSDLRQLFTRLDNPSILLQDYLAILPHCILILDRFQDFKPYTFSLRAKVPYLDMSGKRNGIRLGGKLICSVPHRVRVHLNKLAMQQPSLEPDPKSWWRFHTNLKKAGLKRHQFALLVYIEAGYKRLNV